MTYREAVKTMENKATRTTATFTGDAGDGFTWEVHWCSRRKRVISQTRTPSGHVIH